MMRLSLHGKLFPIEIKTIVLLAGGAERLMVDVACQLTAHGHNVQLFTSHHDKTRCFEENVSGKVLSASKFVYSYNSASTLPCSPVCCTKCQPPFK